MNGPTAAVASSALFLAAVAALVRWAELPSFVFWTYVVASVVAFVVYAVDKAAAGGDSPRTPEITLHFLGWIGGWPGAFVAQRVLRHKTRKVGFQVVFWLTVAAHCAALGWWASAHR
jgi:uncharacterized membrane protein YsdA (DUF1294 family)